MLDLTNAEVYDIEVLINCFTLSVEMLNSDVTSVWEISDYRDDRVQLLEHLDYLYRARVPTIGFNNVHYDYPILHFIYTNPTCTAFDIYCKSQEIIASQNRFAHIIWERDRFAPQIDLFKINHFDNKAKSTGLKALEVNMRSHNVLEAGLPWDKPIDCIDIDRLLIPYNKHDVSETKKFAKYCMTAIEFRIGLIPQFGLEVMNWNDTKIGEELLIQRIGPEVCFDFSSGRKVKRQTVRDRIALNDIIFPYIHFQHPELNRVLDYLRQQVLTPADIDIDDTGAAKEPGGIVTKGVFKGLTATVGDIELFYGTGGIHASVPAQKIVATDDWLIRDIDVASLYPSIGIVNRLAPQHLGEAFIEPYSSLPAERKDWQKKKGKKCTEANSLKLAGNGAYGKTNSMFSALYDPQYTMTITVNGQLMLSMLHEWLCAVPTYRCIQINTDGITYYIHRDYLDQAKQVEQRWQDYTKLMLEDAQYRRMWIRDVNNYVAETMDGSLKQKGAYWHPDPLRWHESISEAQPPAWHKDLSNIVSIRAAVAQMVYGVPIEQFIALHTDPFDFMLRTKVGRADTLLHGDRETQRVTRYYIAKQGAPLIKVSPPKGPLGAFKKANGVTDAAYARRMAETGGAWCESVCTKNKSVYEERRTNIQAGWLVAECNDASHFDFANVNQQFYIEEAKKLIIA